MNFIPDWERNGKAEENIMNVPLAPLWTKLSGTPTSTMSSTRSGKVKATNEKLKPQKQVASKGKFPPESLLVVLVVAVVWVDTPGETRCKIECCPLSGPSTPT